MNPIHFTSVKSLAPDSALPANLHTAKLPDNYRTLQAQRKADLPGLKSQSAPSSSPLWEKRIRIAPDAPGRIYESTKTEGYVLPPTHHIPAQDRRFLTETLNALESFKTPKETLASLNQAPEGRHVFLSMAAGIHEQTGTGAINTQFRKGDPNSDFVVLLDPVLKEMPKETRLAALYEQLLFADMDLNRRPLDITEQIRKSQKMDHFHREIGAPTHFEEQFARELRGSLIESGQWNQARDKFTEVWSPRVQTSLLELRIDGKTVALADEFAWLENLYKDLSHPTRAKNYQERSLKLREALNEVVNLGLADPRKMAEALEAESFIAGKDWKDFLNQLKANSVQPLSGEKFKQQRDLYLSPKTTL